jgi:hypothetical protein
METERSQRTIRRALVALWLFGALLIAYGGTVPGHEHYRSGEVAWLYPKAQVLIFLALSTLELSVTWLILRPSSYRRSYLRSGLAVILLTPWAVFSAVLTMHAPGFVAGHAVWVLSLLCLVAVLFFVSASSAARRALQLRAGARAA